MGHGANTNCDICVSKFAAGLTKLVSSSDTAVHSPGPACCKYHYTSCHLTHTHGQMYTGRPQSPQLVLQAAHYCTILARLNHSLMGGLTDWYCYSLWGLALHTNRRLSRSRCQQRRSGYLHAYNGLEWNPTGGNLPCPPGTSECHNMGYLEGIVGRGIVNQWRIVTPMSPLTCKQPSPEGQQVPRLAPLSCDRVQFSSCAGSSVEGLQTTTFPFLGNRPPAFVLSLSTLPISFFSWHNQKLSEPSRNHINLTWKHTSWPASCPRCIFPLLTKSYAEIFWSNCWHAGWHQAAEGHMNPGRTEGGEDGDAGHVFLAKKLAGETCAGCLATECCGQDIWQSLTLWECDSGAFIFGPGP